MCSLHVREGSTCPLLIRCTEKSLAHKAGRPDTFAWIPCEDNVVVPARYSGGDPSLCKLCAVSLFFYS